MANNMDVLEKIRFILISVIVIFVLLRIFKEYRDNAILQELVDWALSLIFPEQINRTLRLYQQINLPRDVDSKEKCGLLPLHIVAYSHFNLSMYNTKCNAVEILQGSLDYEFIKQKFMSTTQPHFQIHQILWIRNMHLDLFYLLKLEEYKILYGVENVREEILFHGTSLENIYKICNNNFDWRLHSTQGLYGKGVNFTSISGYASNYCENSVIRAMIAANVLISHSCQGNNNEIPPYYDKDCRIRYDTTQRPDGQVFVKYADDEFIPRFVILFTGNLIKKIKKENNPSSPIHEGFLT